MSALKLFSEKAPNLTFFAIVCGATGGLLYACLIPIIMRAAADGENAYVSHDKVYLIGGVEIAHPKLALVFICLCLAILCLRTLSQVLLYRIALLIRLTLRLQLYRRISDAPIAALEQVGRTRLIQGLTADVSSIVSGAQILPELVSAGVVTIGLLGYLACINVHTLLYVVSIVIAGASIYLFPMRMALRRLRHSRQSDERLQEAFKSLIDGAKELKLSTEKSETFEKEELHSAELQIRASEATAWSIFSIANNVGGLMCFFAIGGLSFVFLNYYPTNSAELISSVMVLLYLTGPVAAILNCTPQWTRTKVALQSLEKLYRELPKEPVTRSIQSQTNWRTLQLQEITYRYERQGLRTDPFEIGPMSFKVTRGEITFVIGGNGSGKSTLAKIISQHYLPTSGDIWIDGSQRLCANTVSSFRNEIFAIYSDFHLFSRLPLKNASSPDFQRKAHYLLESFGLIEKVTFADGRFSTLKLSDGQRKRLALILAILEEKSLYVFDEWAADQETQFRCTYYTEILPLLRDRGCAIVVVSHDERYFGVADQRIRLERGCLVDRREASDGFNGGVAAKAR